MFPRIYAHFGHHSQFFSLAHVTFAGVDPAKEIFPAAPAGSPSENRSVDAAPTTRGGVPHNALALDSADSVSIIKDPSLLDQIWDLIKAITIHCGGILTRCHSKGTLSEKLKHLPLPKEGYIVFPNGVANLISLAVLAKEYRVLYDSSIDDAFYVFNDDGTYIKFARQDNGLYIYFVPDNEKHKYSTLDCKRAERVRELQNALCLPSD